MAIEASVILPSDSLEEFRVQFNNLISDVEGVSGGNSFVSTIIFEGSTADANETTILATDPTSDRTITLPDATGTFITTGNSGDPATTTAAADADHVLINDGGVLKKITRANLGIGGTAGAVAADDLTAGDAAVSIATTAGNITIDAQGSNTDIIFKGTDGSSDITPMTLDMSDAGALLLTGGKIDLKNAGTASQILFYCESSNAHAQTLIAAPHSEAATNTLTLPDGNDGVLLSTVSTATVTNKTLTAPVINTATVGTSITPASDDGATLGSANLNWSDLYLADSAEIKFGDDQDFSLKQVGDGELSFKRNSTSDDSYPALFLDTGETDIAVNDLLGAIHFRAPDEAAGSDAILSGASILAQSEGDFSATNNATSLKLQTGNGATPTTKVTIKSAGDVILDAGDLIFGTAGKGIVLGATSNTAANTLDDYEEGTFTAAFRDADANGNVAAFGYARSTYIKVGHVVTVWINMYNIDTSGQTGGNAIRITDLPFTAANNGTAAVGSMYTNLFNSGGDDRSTVPTIAANESQANIYYVRSDGAASASVTIAAVVNSGADMDICLTYQAA